MDIIDRIRGYFFSVFGKNPDEISEIHLGVMTRKFFVGIDTGNFTENYVIRIFPPDRSFLVLQESATLKVLNSLNVASPKFVCSSLEIPLAKDPFIMYRYLEGVPLGTKFCQLEETSRLSLIEQIANNLLLMKHVRHTEYGERGNHTLSWQRYLENVIKRGEMPLSKHNLLEYKTIHRLMGHGLVSFGEHFSSVSSVLVWLDLSVDNIIIDDDKVAGLIDFESIVYGDPIMSLGFLYAKEGSSQFFLELKNCLRKHMIFNDDLINFYALIRLFRIAPYLSQKLPSGEERRPVREFFQGVDEIYRKILS